MQNKEPIDPTVDFLKERLLKAEQDLEAVLELAAHLQDDYDLKLPVVASFRRWRSGAITTLEFLKRLCEDDLANVLRYERVPPMKGLAILNDHRARRKS